MTAQRRPKLWCAIALVSMAFAAISCGSAAPPEKSPQQTAAEQLDKALAAAETVANGVRRWLLRTASDAADAIDEWSLRAQRAFEDAARDIQYGAATTAPSSSEVRGGALGGGEEHDDDATIARTMADAMLLPRCFGRGDAACRGSSKTPTSGREPRRTGSPVVPSPRLTYRVEAPRRNSPRA